MKPSYDLMIIGGGLVGAGLAAALGQAQLRIALIDAKSPSQDDPRLFALNSGSCHFLENLGIWAELAPYASPIHQVHVSQRSHFGAVRLRREEIGVPTLGHVIPARYIEAAINEKLLTLSNIDLYQPAKLQSLKQTDNKVEIIITSGEGEKHLDAPIAIGADGTDSTVRSLLNLPTKTIDYGQSAIVTRTTLQRAHQNIAYERFNNQGAIAMLPLTGNECATIWTAENKLTEELMALSNDDFVARLQKEFGYRLGRLQAITQRHHFPLRMVQAEKACEGNVLLLGNAAHTLHPIAAQGFNLALYEVAVLAENRLEKLARQETFTAVDLQQIGEQFTRQQAISIGASHRLSQLFSSHSIFLDNLLQLGLVGLDVAVPLKKRFLEKMMGRTGRVPRLLLSAGNHENISSRH